ncbi:MAG: ABC transporter permease [Alphaproteobacteria bacterium]|nr:ABC transporter permease [Alphaproteobacteria bacterium]
MTAADAAPYDTPPPELKRQLQRANRLARWKALGLVAPLLVFLIVTFIVPILSMLTRSVYSPAFGEVLPHLSEAVQNWDGDGIPDEAVFAILVTDMMAARSQRTIGQAATRLNYEVPGTRSLVMRSARRVARLYAPYSESLPALDPRWGEREIWAAIKRVSEPVTPTFYLSALDRTQTADGSIVLNAEEQRLYVQLFWRTLWVSALVMVLCLALGFPIAYLMAHMSSARANLLMILVLLPFWTSLLVRTTAWIALLQTQGVLNDLMVWAGLVSDDGRIQLIYNQIGTVVAMTHILLPFTVLPLYAVMRGIPPSLTRAALSLGATPASAFMRVYLPLTAPGIGAGAVLVFILAVGYYITPALVGGRTGQLISNLIAFHMQESLNWGLAAALGALLLAGVLALYWLYDRLVGIDKMRLG